MRMKTYKDIDHYIAEYPPKVQAVLRKLRATIRKAAPSAKERISYGIPTFTLGRNLVHFAAYERHIGFYPGSGAIAAFKKDLTKYETAKGTVRFPLEKPVPLPLISRIVKFRVGVETARSKVQKKNR